MSLRVINITDPSDPSLVTTVDSGGDFGIFNRAFEIEDHADWWQALRAVAER